MDRSIAYNILYALAALEGRESILFGSSAPRAREAFGRSCPGSAFPEIWFEIPLAGEPWFDLHVLTAREDLEPDGEYSPHLTGGYPEVFSWFARQGVAVRQLALSYDTGRGDSVHPAVQLLVRDPAASVEFLRLVGGQGMARSYEAFAERLPADWFPCYTGAFPGRPETGMHVECIPSLELQEAYADDADLLAHHLSQVGFRDVGDTVVSRSSLLAKTPFQLEFQFDVHERGVLGSTLGVSLRFANPSLADSAYQAFDASGSAGELMAQVEGWGLADDRWRLLEHVSYAKRLSRGDEGITFYTYPAFVKLRWRDARPLDAKAYLIAGEQPMANE